MNTSSAKRLYIKFIDKDVFKGFFAISPDQICKLFAVTVILPS